MKIKKVLSLVLVGLVSMSSIMVSASEMEAEEGAERVKEKILEIESETLEFAEVSKASVEFQNLMNAICIEDEYPSYYAGLILMKIMS